MRHSVRRSSICILAAVGALLAAAPAAGAHARHVRGPVQDPRHSVGRSTSTNWSGYDVTGGGATHVIGSWTQPMATCAPGENSWSSPWVGIDGDTSNTVEQIGTDSDCRGGTPFYYAWYEMYPKGLVQISMDVVPGHTYTAEVTARAGGAYLLALTDTTARQSFSTTQTNKRAQQSSVEWIMEGPSSGLLTDFTTVAFSAASAAVNGQNTGLSSLSGATPITMVSAKGNTVRALPSGLNGKDGFSVDWKSG